MISSISNEFYNTYCSDVPIQSLDSLYNGKLHVTSASTNTLNLLGYIEINIYLPGLSEPILAALIIISNSILSEDMPALIGSNILEVWKDALIRCGGKNPLVVNDKTICATNRLVNEITIPVTMVQDNSSNTHIPTSNTIETTLNIQANDANYNTVQDNNINSTHIHSKDSCSVDDLHNQDSQRKAFLALFDCSKCPNEYRKQLEDVLCNNRESFATSHHELGKCNTVKHDIKLSDYSPIRQKYRRIPPNMFEAVKSELKKMKESGVIRHSMSPWASPVTVVVKPDGSPRICLDLRKVNELTKKDAKSVPNVQEMFDMLNGKTIFSSLDLFSGFFQIELEEECKELTAFTCGPLGFWEMNRMPFGACNSSATFQRTMELVLDDLLYSSSLVYVDDIIVHATNPTEHINNLDKVFKRLNEHGLRLKPSKCTFFSSELKFLGHMITSNGVEKDPSKIQAILDWKRPTTVTEVRQFMGLCGFLRKFIKNFATIAAPITDLSRGYKNGKKYKRQNMTLEETNFIWTENQENAFITLKKVIAEDVTLSYADFDCPFRLSTDACRTGLGAVLEQQEQNGNWRPIGFASRRTNDIERNYATHKLEFLALKWAITDKFSDYLRTKFFTVYTDNNPLTYVLSNPKLDATAQRWVSSLEPYSFIIKYKPGTDNTVADALSRKYEKEDADDTIKYQTWVKTICEGFEDEPNHVTAITLQDTMGNTTLDTDFNWKTLQEEDETISTVKNLIMNDESPSVLEHSQQSIETRGLMKHFSKLIIVNDLIYYESSYNNKHRLVVPTDIQTRLTKLYHSLGHPGIKKLEKLLNERFFWNNMKSTITKVISTCERCQKSKTPKHKNRGPLQHIQSPTIPMYQLSMDFLQIDTRANSKLKILSVIDEFTKFGWAITVKSENAKITAEKLYRELYTKFGIPAVIHTDRGQTFVSKIIKELNNILSIKHTVTTSYRPESNATCERFNETIVTRIRSLPHREKSRWHLHVDSLIFAYNSTVHESIGMSPYYAMFGRHPKLPLDMMVRIPLDKHNEPVKIDTYAKQRQKEMKEAFRTCADNTEKRRIRSKRNFDDKKVQNPILKFFPSDKVLLINHTPKNKIDDCYNNEIFEIIEQKGHSQIYVVRGLETSKIKSVHRDTIIPFKEAETEVNQTQIHDIQSWHEMKTPSPEAQSTMTVNKDYNKKIALYLGDSKMIKSSCKKIAPMKLTHSTIKEILVDKQNTPIILQLDSLHINKRGLDIIIKCIRQEISKFVKVILTTQNHNVYNQLINLMHIHFPKYTYNISRQNMEPHILEESESSSEYENTVIPNNDQQDVENDGQDSSDDQIPDSDSSVSSDSSVNSVHTDTSSDSSSTIKNSSSSESNDAIVNSNTSEDSKDNDPEHGYNLRSSGRRPSVKLRDYFTVCVHVY